MTSFSAPKGSYIKPLSSGERFWMIFASIWCLILFFMMYAWMAIGKQQTPIESYRIETAQFRNLTEAFIKENKVDEINGVPVVVPNAKGEVYLGAKAFLWSPVLKLKKGVPVKIYLSSYDYQHGMSVQPLNLNFQALPGYVYVVNLTPDKTGEFPIICNEYCGLGHHAMSGRIIVTD